MESTHSMITNGPLPLAFSSEWEKRPEYGKPNTIIVYCELPIAVPAIETDPDLGGAAVLPHIRERFLAGTDQDATGRRALNIYNAGVADKFCPNSCFASTDRCSMGASGGYCILGMLASRNPSAQRCLPTCREGGNRRPSNSDVITFQFKLQIHVAVSASTDEPVSDCGCLQPLRNQTPPELSRDCQ